MGVVNTPTRNRELIAKAGGPSAVAALLKITPQAVGLWYNTGVPPANVIPICESVYFTILPHELRPDIYPHPEDGLPAALRERAHS